MNHPNHSLGKDPCSAVDTDSVDLSSGIIVKADYWGLLYVNLFYFWVWVEWFLTKCWYVLLFNGTQTRCKLYFVKKICYNDKVIVYQFSSIIPDPRDKRHPMFLSRPWTYHISSIPFCPQHDVCKVSKMIRSVVWACKFHLYNI